jgi:hypothetical protein
MCRWPIFVCSVLCGLVCVFFGYCYAVLFLCIAICGCDRACVHAADEVIDRGLLMGDESLRMIEL